MFRAHRDPIAHARLHGEAGYPSAELMRGKGKGPAARQRN